jgi:hypothetical protein
VGGERVRGKELLPEMNLAHRPSVEDKPVPADGIHRHQKQGYREYEQKAQIFFHKYFFRAEKTLFVYPFWGFPRAQFIANIAKIHEKRNIRQANEDIPFIFIKDIPTYIIIFYNFAWTHIH